MENRNNEILYSILGYFGILVLIPILAGKDSAFCKHHANQSLVLLIAEVASVILTAIAGIGGIFFVFQILSWILSLGCFVFFILGIISAAKYETKPLPLIGEIKILK